MVNNKSTKQEENLQELERALTKSELFLEKNQKTIIGVLCVAIIIAVGYLAYTNFVVAPKEQKAKIEITEAQRYFDVDSFNLAINGDGTNAGFLDIIDQYGSTATGNLAKYYAGVSYARLGSFKDAISYLNGFNTKDPLLAPVSEGLVGDCNLELGNISEAIKAYKKAITHNNNLTAPVYLMKLGQVYESEGKYSDALDSYNTIKEKYSNSTEGNMIDKYIARVNAKK